MRYYEGHDAVYKKLQEQGCHSWDEYLGQAADFDSFCMKQFVGEAFARSTFSSPRPLSLEVGCGTGPICCYLAGKGFQVEGMDISCTAIAIAQRLAKDRGLEIRYQVGDVCRDWLDEQRYDLVVDGHCLHCIVDEADRHNALKNIRAAMRPGAYFWIDTMVADPATDFGRDTILDHEGILWVKISASGRFDLEKQLNGQTYLANRRIYHDPDRLNAELQEAGFVIAWSDVISPEKQGDTGTYQAVCTTN